MTAAGRHGRFTIELGGVAIAFDHADPRWQGILDPRYRAFRTRRAPEIVVELRTGGEPRDLVEVGRLRNEAVHLRCEGATVRLHSRSLEASVAPERGAARLVAPLDRHGVDVLLPVLLALRFDDALMVHGALAIEAGRAFVCAGPSGAGKSTLARLLGARAYCDELVLLLRDARGWNAHSLPFWQGRPGVGKLAGLRVLRHGARHRLRSLDAEERLRRLSRELIWPAFSAQRCDRTLELLERLVAEVTVAELAFRPDADVWPALSAELAA